MSSSPSPLAQFSVGSDNAIKNITSEVVRDCAKLDIHAEESVVSLAVRLLCLDPANGLQLSEHYERRDLEQFVERCVARFADPGSPSIRTLGMQLFSLEHSIEVARIVRVQEAAMRSKTAKLTNEILSVQCRTAADRERLVKKVAVDVIVNGALGSPANQQLCLDVSTVLRSVMSAADVQDFVAAKRDARLDTLYQLREIVCGIYIFNKDCGFSGKDTVDVGHLVTGGQQTTLAKLQIARDEIEHRVNLLCTVLAMYTDEWGRRRWRLRVGEAEAEAEQVGLAEQLQLLQRVLIVQRQHRYCLGSLLRSLAKCRVDGEQALRAFRGKLAYIREAVQFKTAIPTDQIFPHFIELAHCWHRLQHLIFTLTEINIVNERLMQLSDEVCAWETTAFDLLADHAVQTDDERRAADRKSSVAAPIASTTTTANAEVQIAEYSPKMRLENAGFCTTTLVSSGGLLYPANPELGVCVYQGRNYVFRTAQAAQRFLAAPDVQLFTLVECARSHPELIVLLDCFAQVYAHRNDYHCAKGAEVAAATAEAEAVSRRRAMAQQTELHPVPAGHRVAYTWNMWDMRRKAIQLANLMRSATHSAQTAVSYQRYGVETQTWQPKEAGAQTMRTRWTNVPRPLRAVRRTRGVVEEVARSASVQLTQLVEDDGGCSK